MRGLKSPWGRGSGSVFFTGGVLQIDDSEHDHGNRCGEPRFLIKDGDVLGYHPSIIVITNRPTVATGYGYRSTPCWHESWCEVPRCPAEGHERTGIDVRFITGDLPVQNINPDTPSNTLNATPSETLITLRWWRPMSEGMTMGRRSSWKPSTPTSTWWGVRAFWPTRSNGSSWVWRVTRPSSLSGCSVR